MKISQHWPRVPLDDAFWFQEGPGVRKWQFTTSGIKLLNVGNIVKDGTINLAKTDKHLSIAEVEGKYSHFLADEGDLVIASSGISFDDDGFLRTRGAFIEKSHLPLCINTSTIRFKSIDNVSDLRFFRHWLSSYEFRFQITKLVTGTAQQNFGPSHLKSLTISLPQLPEQKRIAAILDKADSIRRKRQEAVRMTEELLRSVFLDMFGDPVTNPQGIKSVCLSEVTTRITDGTHQTPKFIDSGVPFIFVKNIKNGKIDFQTDKYISEEEHKKLYERCPVEEGDILYTTVGATYGQAVAVGSFTKFAFQRHVAHVKPDKCKVLSDYLGTIMQLPIVKNQADRWARGAAQPTVNLTELRDFVIPLPPLHLQREFAQKVAAVEKLKTVCRLPLEHAETLFNSLLQRAFSGELKG